MIEKKSLVLYTNSLKAGEEVAKSEGGKEMSETQRAIYFQLMFLASFLMILVFLRITTDNPLLALPWQRLPLPAMLVVLLLSRLADILSTNVAPKRGAAIELNPSQDRKGLLKFRRVLAREVFVVTIFVVSVVLLRLEPASRNGIVFILSAMGFTAAVSNVTSLFSIPHPFRNPIANNLTRVVLSSVLVCLLSFCLIRLLVG